MLRTMQRLAILAALVLLPGAAAAETPLQAKAKALFGSLPERADNPANQTTDTKVELGRMLYYEPDLPENGPDTPAPDPS